MTNVSFGIIVKIITIKIRKNIMKPLLVNEEIHKKLKEKAKREGKTLYGLTERLIKMALEQERLQERLK